MAEHAHSTTVPAESNSEKTKINRRTAFFGMPAISGAALLAATAARAAPVSDILAKIARLEAAKPALKAAQEASWRLDDAVGPFARVLLHTPQDGRPVYAYSEREIQEWFKPWINFWGTGSNAQKDLDAKLTQFQAARAARIKAEADSGLTACLDHLEIVATEHDEAFDALLQSKPATLTEARAKLASLMEPLIARLTDYDDDDDVSALLHALL